MGIFFAVNATLCGPACADSSVALGLFAPGPSTKSIGILASTGLTLPIAPIAPQATLAVPFGGNGRYALTGEARIGNPKVYVGAGGGFGRMNSSGSTGTIYDAFIGLRVAPLTSIEARFYGAGSDRAGSSGFIGLRFSI